MPKLTVIIPVYYSEDTLRDCYIDLKNNVFSKITEYELIIVDDGSGDNSYEIMKEIAKEDPNVKLLKLSRNFGSHAAIYAGLCESTGDCVALKAADCQESADLITEMYYKWQEGNKIVLAVREGRVDGSIFTNLYYIIVRKFISKTMPKGGFDIFLIDRNVVETLKLLDEKNSAITLQILWTGFKTATVPYNRLARTKGKSRWTLGKKLNLVIDSFIGFSSLPLKIITTLGFLYFVIAVIWGIFLLISKIFGFINVEGWTTLAVIILMSSGIIMLMLGILSEYIWRILDAARGRPVYIIDEQDEQM